VEELVDAHNDLLVELAFRSGEANPFAARWLQPLRAGNVRLQVCPISAQYDRLPEGALREALQQIAACYRAVSENNASVRLVQEQRDLDAVASEQRVGLMLSMEGAEPLGYSVDLAEVFWRLGVRMFGLTWNRRNAFADGCGEPGSGGLSRLGGLLVNRLVDLGAMVDLAHASERTFFDVLEATASGAVLVSHAGCRAVFDTPRNLSDRQLRALADRGGMLGVMVLPPAVDPANPTVERVLDHIDHAVSVMGTRHVGLGADFYRQVAQSGAVQKPPDSLRPAGMSLEYSIEGLAGPEDYGRLVEALAARGYSGDELSALLRDNFLRFFRQSLPALA
jgi:membrane dipeptidase